MGRTLARWATAAALVVGMSAAGSGDDALGTPPPSAFQQIEPSDRAVWNLRPAYVEELRPGRWIVEFNDGAAYRFGPCPARTARNCIWTGRQPWVNLHGTRFLLAVL